MTLYQNSLYSFELHHVEPQTSSESPKNDPNRRALLSFDWTEKTALMEYEDFQDACQNYAGFAIEHNALHLLVDTRNFKYRLPETYIAWRDEHLNPRYHRLGVKKFAYIVSPEAVQAMPNRLILGDNGTFSTQYFDNRHEALAWLGQA
jgi:hypothetical protein